MAKPNKTHNELVYDHFSEVMRNTQERMKELAPAPYGFRPRSDKEKQKIVDTISSLPRETSDIVLNMMAERAGHVDGEQKPCELCGFIADMLARKMK